MLLLTSKLPLELANLVVPFNLRLSYHRCKGRVYSPPTTKHNQHKEFFRKSCEQASNTAEICPLVCFCHHFESQGMLYLKSHNLTRVYRQKLIANAELSRVVGHK